MSLADLRVRSAERLLVDALDAFDLAPQRVLATSLGRGQLAAAMGEHYSQAHVTCWFLDLYPARETDELLRGEGRNVEVVCAADLPPCEPDVVALPFSRGGESELARDLLQQGYHGLCRGGSLLAAVDNPKDVWLQHELEKLQKGVTRLPTRWGVVYRLRKQAPLKRLRDFTCEFAFRDGPRLVKAVSRPGVFSHRQLDLGARALLETMSVGQGSRIVDMGCGSGAVGLAAALREDGVHVTAIDSNARAVDCTAAGAQLNGIPDRITTVLSAEGEIAEPKSYDLVVGNPPYYSQYTIAELFLQTARRALRKGGEVLMVSKQSEWFVARMGQLFDDVREQSARGYVLIQARQR